MLLMLHPPPPAMPGVRIWLLADGFVLGFVPDKLVLKGHPQSISLSQQGADDCGVAGGDHPSIGKQVGSVAVHAVGLSDWNESTTIKGSCLHHVVVAHRPRPRRRPSLQRRPNLCVFLCHITPK